MSIIEILSTGRENNFDRDEVAKLFKKIKFLLKKNFV
jgi:hypothetical protein